MSATTDLQNKTIIKYEASQDGILAWNELKKDYAYNGSMELRIEQLEATIQKPYSPTTSGGMASYIDQFQAYVGELETIAPEEYTDSRKKRLLLANIRDAEGVAHLIQKCRDDELMSYEACAAYLRKYAYLIDNSNRARSPRKLLHVKDIEELDHEKEEPSMTIEHVTKLFHTMALESGLKNIYKVFNSKTFRDSMHIPALIWNEIEPSIREKLLEAKARVKEKQNNRPKPTSVAKIPDQYPTKKTQDHVINLCSSIADLGIEGEDDSTDDEAITFHAFMTISKNLEPGKLAKPQNDPQNDPDQPIKVRAHLEYGKQSWYPDKVYAIADGGADSCIIGQNAKVISYTGRFANLVGYNPETTRTEKVPIVTALLKAKSSSNDYPVLLKVHEAPYNSQSPITLLSEYQIREYGLVIDSVAKKHMSSHGMKGTQRFELNKWVHINFEDRGGLMGFELLPIEPGDEDRYDVITITNPERWYPNKYQNTSYHTSSTTDSLEVKNFEIKEPSEASPDPIEPLPLL